MFLFATVTSECRHTDCRVSPTRGLISCPTAPPNGLAISCQSAAAKTKKCEVHIKYIQIAIIIVAVVLPFKSNQVSEYFGAMTW